MAKKIDIAQVFIWASNVLDTNQLTIGEQATLFNLIKLINRNFWRPVTITAYKLAQNMCCDLRTVKRSLPALIQKNIIHAHITNENKLEGVFYIGYVDEQTFKSLISRQIRAEGNQHSKQNGDTNGQNANSISDISEQQRNRDFSATGATRTTGATTSDNPGTSETINTNTRATLADYL